MKRRPAILQSSAVPVLVAMFHDVQQEWPLERMLQYLPKDIDLVIAEGFKDGDYPYVKVYRQGVSRGMVGCKSWNMLAIVGDDPGGVDALRFHRDAIPAIGAFVIDKCQVSTFLFFASKTT